MSRTSPGRTWPGSATLLLGLLLVVLALAGLVAYEAVQAARSRRVTAERALRDYATFASWELIAKSTTRLENEMRDALSSATGTRATSPYDRLPSPQVIVASAAPLLLCNESAGDPNRLHFRLDLRDGSLATTGPAPSPTERRWITDTLTKEALRPGQRFGTVDRVDQDSTMALVFGIKQAQYGAFAEPGAPIAVYGFLTCRSAIGVALLKRVFATEALLPQAVSRGLPNDSLLTLTVYDAAGRSVYASAPGAADRFSHEVAMDPPAALRVRVGLRETAASRLDVPVTPSSRLPLLLTLLALSGGLAAIGLRQLRREHELARLRSDFTSSVSHELRTPLAQILLYGETLTLERARNDDERRAAAETIVQEARRLMRLVDNVLQYARLERGLTGLAPEPALLAPRLRGILSAFLATAPPGTLRVRTDLDEGVAAPVDSGALTQIVLNLLDNAVKYGPAGQMVTVSLSRHDGIARISVADQGHGIPESERAHIWEPFVRVTHGGNGTAGSGLGLAVVKDLVQGHGGTVDLESSSSGACFIVSLPACQPPNDPDQQ
jgi:signal transduction histidine kinase